MSATQPQPLTHERERVLRLVQRYGWNATAFQTLEPGYRYFFHGEHACVAYVRTPGAWVAAGAPIAPLDALRETSLAFVRAARERGKRSVFFATQNRFRERLQHELSSLAIGQQPEWDPQHWPAILASHRSLREQLRRARAKGLRVRRVSSDELRAGPTRDAIARIAARWLSERGMAPMSFLVHLDPFSFAAERTCFVAEQHGHVVAFAGVIPVPARAGWFVEDLVRDAHAPNGTSELLVDATMRWAAASGSRWVTLGLSPLAGEVSTLLRLARSTTAPLYDFEGVRSYKAKLRPHAWSPVYLAYPREQTPVTAVLDSLGAFAGGDLVGFGARSLVARVSQTRNLGSLSVPRLLRRRSPSAPLAPC